MRERCGAAAVVAADDGCIYACVLACIYVCVLFCVILLARRFVSFVIPKISFVWARGAAVAAEPGRAAPCRERDYD